MNIQYHEFLERKRIIAPPSGINIAHDSLSGLLFDFQRDIVAWALRRGRAAIFADCGMGKTFMLAEWARHIVDREGPVLILAPLAVAKQTLQEGEKFGIQIQYAREQPPDIRGITVTNYEMMHRFDASKFSGVVLDESSILKSYDGKTRIAIIDAFARTPYKLACTATPAPNDYMELGNHAEFLGIMSRVEMLSMFFVHDGGETSKWRLKGHAEEDFWRWLASWSMMIRRPSDLGYADSGFALPPLNLHEHYIRLDKPTPGYLFSVEAASLQERIIARRESVSERVDAVASLVNRSAERWVIWCHLNTESDALGRAIPDAIVVTGSQSMEEKEANLNAFTAGEARVVISKPSIAGLGLNWQHCSNIAFVGLSDSWEQFYQAVRRCWRYGQINPVEVHLIVAETEGAVLRNILKKEEAALTMAENIVGHMRNEMQNQIHSASVRTEDSFESDIANGDGWVLHLGDCVDVVMGVPDNSVHFSIFSPPFASLYTYSASDRDMGNCKGLNEFTVHFGFLVRELFRIIKPGRLLSFHCMNLPTSKVNDGFIGLRDFRGILIKQFEDAGFIFHSEVCIWKDPVVQMQRTKSIGLLYKQLRKDSALSRQGIADYLVTMRKPGTNDEPITKTHDSFPVAIWQRYASPVWLDINPSDTLQKQSAREDKDERHIAPLQLEVIRRAIELWTNPGDLILSPFAGIGSEGYCALQMGRLFIGAELKRSYWTQAKENLRIAKSSQGDLFSMEVAS